MIVEPHVPVPVNNRLFLVSQTFDLQIGVVHACFQHRLMEIPHGHQMPHVPGSAPHLNAQFTLDVVDVFLQQFVSIVVDVVLPVGTQVVVGVGIRFQWVEIFKRTRYAACQVEQRAEQGRIFHRQPRRPSSRPCYGLQCSDPCARQSCGISCL